MKKWVIQTLMSQLHWLSCSMNVHKEYRNPHNILEYLKMQSESYFHAYFLSSAHEIIFPRVTVYGNYVILTSTFIFCPNWCSLIEIEWITNPIIHVISHVPLLRSYSFCHIRWNSQILSLWWSFHYSFCVKGT